MFWRAPHNSDAGDLSRPGNDIDGWFSPGLRVLINSPKMNEILNS